MRLSFQSRLLACFGGLAALAVLVLLGLMSRWTSARLEAEVAFRLQGSSRILEQMHASARAERLRRFASLAIEPRFRALAEAGDAATLRHAAAEVRRELGCAALGFLDIHGATLAWDGAGEAEVPARFRGRLAPPPTQAVVETTVVGTQPLEVALVPLRVGDDAKGFLVAASALDPGILSDYAVGTGGRVEIREGGRVLAASGPPAAATDERSVAVPLAADLAFVIQLDVSTLAGGLREARRILGFLAIVCVVVAGVVSVFVARRISQPLGTLARAARAVGEGDLSVQAAETGAPELVELARNFNGMVGALARSRDELRGHAELLEQRVKTRTHEAEEARARAEANLATAQAMQQQVLLQQEKLAALGLLAAGVVHEINNPMSYVYGNLQTLEEYVRDLLGMLDRAIAAGGAPPPPAGGARPPDLAFLREDLPRLIRDSVEGAERIIRIIRDMKTHVHAGAERMEPADLTAAMESTLNIVAAELRGKVTVVKAYAELPPVRCYAQQIRQVFLNLLVNAAHAIGRGPGTITIRSRLDGARAVWEIADTGAGMPDDVRRRLFQPFFTTKGVGQGTGLGLYTVQTIVQRHRGEITVDSRPGVGSTFRVILPLDPAAAGGEPRPTPAPDPRAVPSSSS